MFKNYHLRVQNRQHMEFVQNVHAMPALNSAHQVCAILSLASHTPHILISIRNLRGERARIPRTIATNIYIYIRPFNRVLEFLRQQDVEVFFVYVRVCCRLPTISHQYNAPPGSARLMSPSEISLWNTRVSLWCGGARQTATWQCHFCSRDAKKCRSRQNAAIYAQCRHTHTEQ